MHSLNRKFYNTSNTELFYARCMASWLKGGNKYLAFPLWGFRGFYIPEQRTWVREGKDLILQDEVMQRGEEKGTHTMLLYSIGFCAELL